MAVPSLPTRDAVRQAIASFVKLARDAPSVKGNKAEAELFGSQLPVAFAKACTTAQAHASSGHAATRFVVDEVTRQEFYRALVCMGAHSCARVRTKRPPPWSSHRTTAPHASRVSPHVLLSQAGVVDMLAASPDKRLCVPRSTLRMLPAPLDQIMAQMVPGGNVVSVLPLYSNCTRSFLGAYRAREWAHRGCASGCLPSAVLRAHARCTPSVLPPFSRADRSVRHRCPRRRVCERVKGGDGLLLCQAD
jgi:hypothetical protein